ncbi:hypothetical protein ASF21_04785 [Arthrobacter sp. Leaf234]|nr:hypothetical protein ASF21_04785 [Arthrobacter sp. Leaf234]
MHALRIDTDRMEEASAFVEAAGSRISDAVGVLGGILERSGGMAGWDALGSDWAASYDPAAAEAADACRELELACSDTSRALAIAAGKYLQAEHIASMGVSALMTPFLPAFRPDGPAWVFPSAADGNRGCPPPGWDIVAGIAGVLWPAGDPEALRSASTAWRELAAQIEGGMDGSAAVAGDAVQGLASADLTQFRTRNAAIQDTGRQIAVAARDIAGACSSLAEAITLAHEELIDETHSFLLECAALAGVGIALSFVTLGGSAAITSLVGAARAAQMVIRVQAVVARLTTAARSVGAVAARLPGAGRLTTGLHALSRTPAALSSLVGPTRRTLSVTAWHAASSPRLSVLAPAVRFVHPVGAAAVRFVDSKAVSLALSNPASLTLGLLPVATRRTVLRSVLPQGNTPERVLELVRAKGVGTQLLPAASAAVRTKERLDTVEGLVGLPAHVGERYLPARPSTVPLGENPGRLTAVRGSPASGPTRGSTPIRRRSRPEASP